MKQVRQVKVRKGTRARSTQIHEDKRRKELDQRNKEFDEYLEMYRRESAKLTRKMLDEADRVGDKL